MKPAPTFCSLSCDSYPPPFGCFRPADVSLRRRARTSSWTRGDGTARKSGTVTQWPPVDRDFPSIGNCGDCAPSIAAKNVNVRDNNFTFFTIIGYLMFNLRCLLRSWPPPDCPSAPNYLTQVAGPLCSENASAVAAAVAAVVAGDDFDLWQI